MAKKPSCWSSLIGLLALGGLLGIAAFGWFTSRYGWPIYLELFSHFQVQYLIISLLLLGILALTRRRFMIVAGLFCCASLAVSVLSWYVPPAAFLPSQPANLRVLVTNVNVRNRSYENTLAIAREASPDLAIFMEVDNAWIEQLNTLRDLLPYSSIDSESASPGLAVYSRLELINPRIEIFGTENKASVVTEIEVGDAAATRRIALVATHPFPPVRPRLFHSRNRQLDQVGTYIQNFNQPTLLVGDLNTAMWSPYYRRLVNKTGLRNSRKGFGIIPTWPMPGTYERIPALVHSFFSIPIDHCLHSPEIRTVAIRAGAATGSDHAPIIVDLLIPPEE
ncbi:MAG: endonuclease/exonuclease/phosphatase family protein [Elainellaceae cyanobacterium]